MIICVKLSKSLVVIARFLNQSVFLTYVLLIGNVCYAIIVRGIPDRRLVRTAHSTKPVFFMDGGNGILF